MTEFQYTEIEPENIEPQRDPYRFPPKVDALLSVTVKGYGGAHLGRFDVPVTIVGETALSDMIREALDEIVRRAELHAAAYSATPADGVLPSSPQS